MWLIFAAVLFNDTASTTGYLKSRYVRQNNRRAGRKVRSLHGVWSSNYKDWSNRYLEPEVHIYGERELYAYVPEVRGNVQWREEFLNRKQMKQGKNITRQAMYV